MSNKWFEVDTAEKTAVTESHSAPRGTSGVFRVQKPHYLELVEGPGAPQKFQLDRPTMIVGRSADADLRIDSEELSRKHMLIIRSGDEFSCEDMDSRNGVFLNGVKIHSATLRDKDTLQLGAVILVYHEGG